MDVKIDQVQWRPNDLDSPTTFGEINLGLDLLTLTFCKRARLITQMDVHEPSSL